MSKKVKYWSGKPTDPEHLNYTAEGIQRGIHDSKEPTLFLKGLPILQAVNREHSEKPENDSHENHNQRLDPEPPLNILDYIIVILVSIGIYISFNSKYFSTYSCVFLRGVCMKV